MFHNISYDPSIENWKMISDKGNVKYINMQPTTVPNLSPGKVSICESEEEFEERIDQYNTMVASGSIKFVSSRPWHSTICDPMLQNAVRQSRSRLASKKSRSFSNFEISNIITF